MNAQDSFREVRGLKDGKLLLNLIRYNKFDSTNVEKRNRMLLREDIFRNVLPRRNVRVSTSHPL